MVSKSLECMSESLKIKINGIESTLLIKKTYPSFVECINHHSLRIENPQEQKNLFIHKYIPLRFLLVLLKEKYLIFKPVSSWEDPYENFFLKQHFVRPGWREGMPFDSIENVTKGLFGMSWSLQQETDSLWRIYSTDKLSVRITSTIESMVETVCSEEDKWDVWMGIVNYKNVEELSEWLNCKEVKDYDDFFEKMTDSFFIKRDAFSHEQEYRIVVNYTREIKPTLCFRCDPEKLIKSYLVDPRLNKYEYEAVKSALLSVGVSESKIAQSSLYDFHPQKVEMKYDVFQDF